MSTIQWLLPSHLPASVKHIWYIFKIYDTCVDKKTKLTWTKPMLATASILGASLLAAPDTSLPKSWLILENYNMLYRKDCNTISQWIANSGLCGLLHYQKKRQGEGAEVCEYGQGVAYTSWNHNYRVGISIFGISLGGDLVASLFGSHVTDWVSPSTSDVCFW